eukprot:TRINITY_DN361_c0_g1_i4.p2 TRINITY_DN361_c0_g1~~TRINITY_DN361_c0_g1_i4.p2  ORF type:complete len:236 (-),score=15.86 TRINITY_DN361_c0_g1_i4:159-866(-)
MLNKQKNYYLKGDTSGQRSSPPHPPCFAPPPKTHSTMQALGMTKARNVAARSGAAKVDIKKQGLNSVKNQSVQRNLMGVSDAMKSKDWKDASGRKGKYGGVYRFEKKYGANVDGYSPIYTPDIWSESGEEYKLGAKGLLAWAGLIVVLLGVGINLVISTSQLGQQGLHEDGGVVALFLLTTCIPLLLAVLVMGFRVQSGPSTECLSPRPCTRQCATHWCFPDARLQGMTEHLFPL